jgi:hypothetical protein
MTPRKFSAAVTALCLAVGLAFAGTGSAAPKGPPPPPKAANGKAVKQVGIVPGTPTAFAFARGTTFVGVFGDEVTLKGGGIYTLKGGRATKVPGTPSGIAGLVQHSGTVYASVVGGQGGRIIALEGWNGTKFAKIKTIFNAGSTVGGVNGLAWRNGRIYGGGGLVNDIGKNGKVPASPFPDPYSVFSIDPNGKDFQVVAGGLRQPWQLTFVAGNPNPMVSVLSQEVNPIPPDAIVNAEPGKDYGFPGCFAGVGSECAGSDFAQPMITFPKHTSPMGIQGVGDTLYVALFGGIGKSGSEVVRIPAVPNGKPTPVLTGYAAPVVALGISGKKLYTGDIAGDIYLGSL